MSDDKPITIITTVHPPTKGGKRPITVAAAPDGELPVFRTGLFAERHQLSDQVFGELLKRKPVAPKANGKMGPGSKTKKRKQLPGHTSPSKVLDVLERVAPGKPDQAGPAALPVIDGDDQAAAADTEQLELETESSDE